MTARFLHECYGPAYACLFHTSEAAAVSHSVNNNFRVVDFDYSICKVEKIEADSLDLIPSHSVKIQIFVGKVYLR